MGLTASLHALADALYAVEVGQFVVGQERLRDGCVEAACHAAALARLVLERDLDAVHSHGRAGATAPEVRVELSHGLLDKLVAIAVDLQSQVARLQVPQLLHLPSELRLLHLETTQLRQDLEGKKEKRKHGVGLSKHLKVITQSQVLVVTSRSRTYRSRFSPNILHKDTAEELEGETPPAQQHVVRDHHPHEATVRTAKIQHQKLKQEKQLLTN